MTGPRIRDRPGSSIRLVSRCLPAWLHGLAVPLASPTMQALLGVRVARRKVKCFHLRKSIPYAGDFPETTQFPHSGGGAGRNDWNMHDFDKGEGHEQTACALGIRVWFRRWCNH